jgi:acyl carrier protein
MTPTDQALSYINRLATSKATEGDECLSDLGLRSIDLIDIACEIETALGCSLTDSEVFRWAYVGDVAASIAGRVG